MIKRLVLFAGLLLTPALALAQISPPILANTSQQDLVQIIPHGQPSAQNQYVPIGAVSAVPTYVYNVPVTAFSLTFAHQQGFFILNPAGTLSTGTVTFEANPSDAQRECTVSTQTQTAITFTANTGQTVVGAPTALTAGAVACFTYVAPLATWFKS